MQILIDPLAGFILGVAGSLHCAGMCGPIVLALPDTQKTGKDRVLERSLYQVGRVGTYTVMGFAVGQGASMFNLVGYGQYVSILAGAFMIVTAFMQIVWHRSVLPSKFLHQFTRPIRHQISTLLKQRGLLAFSAIGALNGLLPCGLVTSALLGSAATTNSLSGAVFMAGFGLGTVPMMLSLALGGAVFIKRLRPAFKVVLPVAVLLVGSIVLLRGMALDIPFISPAEAQHLHKGGCCSID